MISQYANSPKYVALYNGLTEMFSNAKLLEDWFNIVYNLKTATGFGLDIWGSILDQGRQFSYIDNGTEKFVFLGGEQTIDGITYDAEYMESMYRTVLFLKALSNITNCTLAGLNNLLQFFYQGRGGVYVINYGVMRIHYTFEFYISAIEKAIFETVLPSPTGVGVSFEYITLHEYFGFYVDGLSATDQPYAPFDQKTFYR